MNRLKLVNRIIVLMLIAAQFLLILNDFPSENNQSKTAFTAKVAKVKFVFSESEALDGEDDKADFCNGDLIVNNSDLFLLSRVFLQEEFRPFLKHQFSYQEALYLNNCSLLI